VSATSTPRSKKVGPIKVVRAFNDAFNRGDVDGMMALMTADCVYDNTYPPPDGSKYEGHAEVRTFWEDFFRGSEDPRIEIEDIFAAGSRCAMRWTYRWTDFDGQPHHVRGVDLYRIRGRKVAEKLSYVKG
jgi:ketosteroid isomerase-like protein